MFMPCKSNGIAYDRLFTTLRGGRDLIVISLPKRCAVPVKSECTAFVRSLCLGQRALSISHPIPFSSPLQTYFLRPSPPAPAPLSYTAPPLLGAAWVTEH